MQYESQNDYLMHYRTKGSKNGYRRYQKEDGSLTPEGREHYGVGDPRKAGGVGLHDKQGNRVSVASNVKAAYKNAPGVAKAAFKMLFKKKSSNKPAATEGIQQQKKTESSEEAPKKTSKQQKVRNAYKVMGKVLKVGAGVAVATALAYAGSKHIKNKANNLLNQEHSKSLKRIMDQDDSSRKSINSGSRDYKRSIDLLDRQRESTNARVEGQIKYRDYQRNKNNKSTREALKYIRGHR